MLPQTPSHKTSVEDALALAENRRHPEKGHVEARVIHSFGREDQLDGTVKLAAGRLA